MSERDSGFGGVVARFTRLDDGDLLGYREYTECGAEAVPEAELEHSRGCPADGDRGPGPRAEDFEAAVDVREQVEERDRESVPDDLRGEFPELFDG